MADSLDRNCTQMTGEYFFATERYKRGFSVAITPGKRKGITSKLSP